MQSAGKRRENAYQDGCKDDRRMEGVKKIGETIHFHIDAAQHFSEPDTRKDASGQAGRDDQNHQLRIMDADSKITVTECLQGSDLFALRVYRPAHHDI